MDFTSRKRTSLLHLDEGVVAVQKLVDGVPGQVAVGDTVIVAENSSNGSRITV